MDKEHGGARGKKSNRITIILLQTALHREDRGFLMDRYETKRKVIFKYNHYIVEGKRDPDKPMVLQTKARIFTAFTTC